MFYEFVEGLGKEASKRVDISGVLNLKARPISHYEVSLAYGDLVLIVAMIMDYVKTCDEVLKDRVDWEVYYKRKFLKIADRIQEQIDYDYEKALKKCEKKKESKSDIGEDAMLLALKKQEAEAKKEKSGKGGKRMFEQFGKFESLESLNETAKGLRNEGDEESLFALAKENGLDKEDAEDYLDGVEYFATPTMGAMGRLNVEAEDLKPCEIMEDWIDYIKTLVMQNKEMRAAVFKKDIKGCIAELLKWSFEHQYNIPDDIIKAAGIKAGRVTLGIPGAATCKEIIKKYYMEEQK